MKKRTICLLLSLIMLWGCAMAFSACGEQEDNTTVTTDSKETLYDWGEPYVVVCDKLPYELDEKSFSKRFSRYETEKFEEIISGKNWYGGSVNDFDYYIIYDRRVIYEYSASTTVIGCGVLHDRKNRKTMYLYAAETILLESFLGIKSLESLYEK